MPTEKNAVLVTAANGDQGREAAYRFLEGGYSVRAVVADRSKPTARAFAVAGAEVVVADLSDEADVHRAVTDAGVVYAVPLASSRREQEKAANARLLVDAARNAGVDHFIQTTVANAPEHMGFRFPGLDYTFDAYAEARMEIEGMVKEACFPYWTILQPVTFMENFTTSKVEHLHPWLTEGSLDSLLAPETRVQYVACLDIAAFAFAAAQDPARFSGRSVALASQALTAAQVAKILGESQVPRSLIGLWKPNRLWVVACHPGSRSVSSGAIWWDTAHPSPARQKKSGEFASFPFAPARTRTGAGFRSERVRGRTCRDR